MASTLVLLSSVVVFLLGTAHMVLTFTGPKLTPRDDDLRQAMTQVSPVISRQTDMWKCWVGFNASHSLGAMLFAAFYGYLSLVAPGVLFGSVFLSVLGALTLLIYAVLARRYWFSTPLRGIVLALALYLAGHIVARVG